MSSYKATVLWARGESRFIDMRYSRAHRWVFDGAEVPASASPQVVQPPMSDEAAVDPEEAFVASLSSCHMLWFLALAAKAGFVIDRYEDQAEGVLEKDERGRMAMTRVTLRPSVTYDGTAPGERDEAAMHHQAHELCYIANSVLTHIQVEPVVVV